MAYCTNSKIRKYVKGYEFMSFAKDLGSKGISASKKFNHSNYAKI